MSAPSATGPTRQQRRAATRRQTQHERDEVIATALEYLAGAGPTATGVTIVFSDGGTAYFGIDDARQHVANAPQGPCQ